MNGGFDCYKILSLGEGFYAKIFQPIFKQRLSDAPFMQSQTRKSHKQKLIQSTHLKLQQHPRLQKLWHKIPPELWYFNRKSIAIGAAIGVFCAFIPLPIQLPIVFLSAWLLKYNLPVALAMTFITNPITAYPIFHLSYRLGNWLLNDQDAAVFKEETLQSIFDQALDVILPATIGSLFVGLSLSIVTYWVIKIVWQLYIKYKWYHRCSQRSEPDDK